MECDCNICLCFVTRVTNVATQVATAAGRRSRWISLSASPPVSAAGERVVDGRATGALGEVPLPPEPPRASQSLSMGALPPLRYGPHALGGLSILACLTAVSGHNDAMDNDGVEDGLLPVVDVFYLGSWRVGALEHSAQTPQGWMAWVRFRYDEELVFHRFAEADVRVQQGQTITHDELWATVT